MKNSFLFDHFPILTLLTQMSVQQTKLQMQTFAKTVLQGRFLMLCRISLHVLPVIQRRSLTTAHVKHAQNVSFLKSRLRTIDIHNWNQKIGFLLKYEREKKSRFWSKLFFLFFDFKSFLQQLSKRTFISPKARFGRKSHETWMLKTCPPFKIVSRSISWPMDRMSPSLGLFRINQPIHYNHFRWTHFLHKWRCILDKR